VSNVLVVDDNATNRKLVASLLSFEGHTVIEAADGAEALQAARLQKPDLIISDILMPSMDGYEFVRQLRADLPLARTPVIFYTANYHQREAEALAIRCQVERVIVKPCGPADFLSAVDSVLAAGAQSHALTPADFDIEHLRLLTDKLAHTANDLHTVNARLRALTDLSVQLLSEHEPQALFNRMCEGAHHLLQARVCALALTEREGTHGLSATCGLKLATGPPPLEADAGLLGTMLHSPRSFRMVGDELAAANSGLPTAYGPAHSLLAAPIASPSRTYGWICVLDKRDATEFSMDDQRLLTVLAAQAGRIYENGNLFKAVQNYAAELIVEMGERERAVTELLASEVRLRELAETIQDVLFVVTPDLRELIYLSPAYARVWGRPEAELRARPQCWTEYVHPDDRHATLRAQQRIADNLPTPGQLEFRIVRPDGVVRWIQWRVFGICDSSGVVIRAVGVCSDVTERNQAEAKVRHLNRVLAMLSGINSLIVRAEDRATLLNETCRLAISPGMFRGAWCGLVDEMGTIGAAAASGALVELFPDLRQHLDNDDNPIASVMNSAAPLICNDLRASPSAGTWSRVLVEHGYFALVGLPLVLSDKVIGCLLLVSHERDIFDFDEMALLKEMAGDISFALDHIQKAEQLNYLAYYDALTGMPNRSLFVDRLTQLASRPSTGLAYFAVIIVDPERFSVFNDTVGRTAGDELLRKMAHRLANCLGADDLLGRVGSDQFAATLTGIRSALDIPRMIEELWNKWLGSPFLVAEQQVRLTVHAGVAVFPDDGQNAEDLLRNAGIALKRAKDSGRTFAAYTARLTEEVAERVSLEKNLRDALEREEFVLHYQPKVDLETRRVHGTEALIRWNSPTLGTVSPAKFIPMLEESGLIIEVGAWVMRQAILDRTLWLERGLNAPRVAVNVSTLQLRRDDFVRTLTHILRHSGSDPGLDIEVTESLLMQDVQENLEKLTSIRELGVRIALDDFGTGFSSLSYLARLPVHTLKIDRSFISVMLDDPSAMTLVSTIISLARALKLETVAEGVELEEQAKILRLLQCDQMQGFLICRPLPFDAMTAYLSRSRN
jgi:diguanylate cyclase